ncbi:polyketide cyclase [Actinophytocola xanthii]|uniref:Polyketide cyclase n=1 Tax=Actinophytocola xanthii TaxID=1912961 RepID=A0A1Q8C3I2_9PSEU|nr:polyketide cyclase [Actinophytocola xanthii]
MTWTEPLATGAVSVDAAPEVVFDVVSDPVAMVAFAEELRRVRWLRGATGPAVGAWFAGSNRNGWRRWVTHAQVTDLEPGRRFAYRVRTPFLVPISRWEYEVTPEGSGCRVSVRNWLRVPRWFVPMAIAITGEPDRAGTNAANIATTLRRLKAHLEHRPGSA